MKIIRNILLISLVFPLLFFNAVAMEVPTDSSKLDSELFDAIDGREQEKVRELLDKGVNPNARQWYGGRYDGSYRTPLWRALKTRNVAIIEMLLARGAKIDAPQGVPGDTNLHELAFYDFTIQWVRWGFDVPSAQAVINSSANIDTVNEAGFTPLMRAIQRGKLALVRLLLMNGANPNFKASLGGRIVTPLMLLEEGFLEQEIAETLLAAGADPTLTNERGLTAAQLFENTGRTAFSQLIELLQQAEENWKNEYKKKLLERQRLEQFTLGYPTLFSAPMVLSVPRS
jgi:uncharacterized protein